MVWNLRTRFCTQSFHDLRWNCESVSANSKRTRCITFLSSVLALHHSLLSGIWLILCPKLPCSWAKLLIGWCRSLKMLMHYSSGLVLALHHTLLGIWLLDVGLFVECLWEFEYLCLMLVFATCYRDCKYRLKVERKFFGSKISWSSVFICLLINKDSLLVSDFGFPRPVACSYIYLLHYLIVNCSCSMFNISIN